MERDLDERGLTKYDRLRDEKLAAKQKLEALLEKKNLHVIDAELFFRDAKRMMQDKY